MKSWKMRVGRAVTKLSDRLIAKLQSKEYRDAFMDEQVRTWIARQIRVLREQRGWSQNEFAKICGKPQSVISRLEDPDYGKISFQTLLDLRAAFDVGLMVRFFDYGTAIDSHRDLARGAMEVPSFDVAQIMPEVEETGTRFHSIHLTHLDQSYIEDNKVYESPNWRIKIHKSSSSVGAEIVTTDQTSNEYHQELVN